MKKFFALILALCMILAIVACDGDVETPSETDTAVPSEKETQSYTVTPTVEPTVEPTAEPTVEPTIEPTTAPTEEPTTAPTDEPTTAPIDEPTAAPTEEPTTAPTEEPTTAPTEEPTTAPTEEPTTAPTEDPTAAPTEEPTAAPTEEPTSAPTEEPTTAPTEEPTAAPTEEPTTAPTEEPTDAPTEAPTEKPTQSPTEKPTEEPTEEPTTAPVEPMYVTKYPYVDRDGIVHIAFQDTYSFDKAAESVLNIEVTSYKTGSDEKDEAILTVKDGKVYASGCGLAEVTLVGGEKAYVMVHAAPINLLFLTGQSNGSGDPPSASTYEKNEYQDYFIKSPETMAYYTWTGQVLSVETAKDYVPTNLVWETCNTIKNGCNPRVLTMHGLTGGFANFSVCAGLAYEWIEQTGERVWIVNASHGGQPIHCFKPSEDGKVVDNDYYQAITVFNLALQTLYKEVDAGHFTLNHMAYYWFQGEGDRTNTYDYYYKAFAEMHEAIQKDVVYDHGGVEKTIEFCGYFTTRASANTVDELYLSGPRLAQYTAANQLSGPYKNVFLATKATESWIISDKNVEDYFLDVYGSEENFKAIFGYDMPKTLNTVHPEIHYRIFGQNEMGMDAARNTLKFLNYLYPDRSYKLSYEEENDITLKLVSLDGYYEIGDTLYFDSGRMEAHVVPYITPVWRTVEGLSIKVLTEGFEVDGFKITSKNQTATNITVEIYLGKTLLDTRTFKIAYKSSFADNKPLIVNHGTALYPDRRFEGYMPGWDAGFLTYADGSFEVYDQVEEYGWLYDGNSLWGGHGGFYVTNGMRIGPTNTYAEVGTLGIRYTAGKSGKVKIAASTFSPGLASCYVAVFVNGEKVWPENELSSSDKSGWMLFAQTATAENLNNKWADTVLDVKEGDQIVFAVARYDSNPQTLLYPSVEYID